MIRRHSSNRAAGAAPAAAAARPLLRDELRPQSTTAPSCWCALDGDGVRRARRMRRRAAIRSTAPRRPTTAWHIIKRLHRAARARPRRSRIRATCFRRSRAIRGHHMAKAAVEMAAWDLFARQQRRAAVGALLGGTRQPDRVRRLDRHPGFARRSSPSEVATELAAGYRRIKIKIKPGWDVDAVEMVRDAVRRHPADGRRERRVHARRRRVTSRTLDRFDLMMIEQPLDYDDIGDHAALQRRLTTPICLDESIHSVTRGGGGDRARRLPHHQHQAGPRRRARRVDPAARHCAPRTAFRCGTAACSRAASAARTTSICRRCRTSRCRATSRRAAATIRPI